ncbi:MAG: 4-hydroxybenzoate octaprenyltransferase [Pseudomonadota bacterium]
MPSIGTAPASDIEEGGWIDRWAPAAARPYLRLWRLDRPIGTWLLLFPCWWSVALAAPAWPDPWLIVVFAVGAVVMRGVGCTFNDILDRDLDARVQRTADRPLPSGAITLTAAYAFLGFGLLLGFAILLTFNRLTIALGVASLLLVFTYPLMKRVTWWPQFFLGLTFNWGALMGYAAASGALAWPAALLYAGGILWTLGYDTIYAHQDKEDDALVGIKSAARRLGPSTRPALFAFYGGAVVLFDIAGLAAGLGWPFYLALAAAACQLSWQAWNVDIDRPQDCLAKFKSNRLFGWLLLAGIMAGRLAGPP